jgi:phage terminase, large subunit, PBSX family
MQIKRFSSKQLQVMNWWCKTSAAHGCNGIICDGAVRSGKSLCLSLSFILWSFAVFRGQRFALCGKTVTSLRRNIVLPLLEVLEELGFVCEYKASRNELYVSQGDRQHCYFLFGGKDEGSAALIQGVTLAGILLDEVALMPRSFVEQALARCSVEGSRFWFSCNPSYPYHWFYTEWIEKAAEKNMFYLHFTMADNPSLSAEMLARYDAMYTGVFHQRYVQGLWVAAQGAVYPMFSAEKHLFEVLPKECSRYVVSCDYGTVNPASFGLWGYADKKWYRIREYYYDSRSAGAQRTDEEHCDGLETLLGGISPEAVVVDPSAASFIQCVRRRGYCVVPAKNDVADGIRRVASALSGGVLCFHSSCKDSLREFSLYRWDLENPKELPVKEYDHAMDDIRYFTGYALQTEEAATGFFAAVRRAP